MEIKTGRLFLALGLGLSIAAIVTGCKSGPLSSSLNQSPPPNYADPALQDNDHTPPVYTSPTVTPATTNLVNPPSN